MADTLVSPTGTHKVWQVSRVVKGVEISRRGNLMLQSLNFINLVEPEHKIVRFLGFKFQYNDTGWE